MCHRKMIAIVIPAFNEEKLISKVINSVPDYIDFVIVVDDASSDRTAEIVGNFDKRDVILISHRRNQGVGSAIVSGYKKALDVGADIAVVMGGDAQMDPLDLPALLEPIIQGKASYVKGNRLASFDVVKAMPKIRLIGNIILTLVTKISSGYWQIIDSQCGYTVVTKEVLVKLDLDKLYKRYGFPNDMLVKLNVLNVRVKDVAVRPVYATEESKLNILSFTPKIIFLSVKWFFWRKKAQLAMRFERKESIL